jgi:25S rRNA (cytosine2870-C5)-methyltransferase
MKKKQGIPEALSEEHYAKLKRKAGLPVDDPPAKPASAKRRKTSKAHEPPKSKSKSRRKSPTPESDSDEVIDDEFDASELNAEDDEFLDLVSRGKLGDDFIGSEDEDDSVVDSDEDTGRKREQFAFSDDEDDSDREEKLTAANIEGLSRTLDKKLEEDRLAAEAELQESAIQTNINDEGKVEDEDELGGKKNSLLAPDLQLLRQRITETIRVLDDFSKQAETGRSRAEYTSQLLKDICAVSATSSLSYQLTGQFTNVPVSF